MYEEKLLPARSDPLRYIDARFEPRDPVFDAEELIFCKGPRPRRSRRRSPSAAAVPPDAVAIE